MGRTDLPYKLSIGFNELETHSTEGLDWAEDLYVADRKARGEDV